MPGLSPSNEILHSKEFVALSKHLSGHHTSLGEALDAFCEPVEDKYMKTENPADVEGLLWKAWQAIVAVAASTPHTSPNRQKLVDFLLGLEHRPVLMKGGDVCEIQGLKVWKDLPVLGWELRETWNFGTFRCMQSGGRQG